MFRINTCRAGFVGALMVYGLTAGSAVAQTIPDKIEKIGLMVQDMSNPFFSAMDAGARRAAEEIGAELNVQDAQLDLTAQYNQIDAFIQQGVDLIVVSAVDGEGIEPAITKAKEAGIIVIAVDTPATGADAVIMTNAVQAGMRSCTYLFEQMGEKVRSCWSTARRYRRSSTGSTDARLSPMTSPASRSSVSNPQTTTAPRA